MGKEQPTEEQLHHAFKFADHIGGTDDLAERQEAHNTLLKMACSQSGMVHEAHSHDNIKLQNIDELPQAISYDPEMVYYEQRVGEEFVQPDYFAPEL